jgi:hypothetical protein
MATWTKWSETIIDTGIDDVASVSGYGYGYTAKVRVSKMTRTGSGSGNARPYRVAVTSKIMPSVTLAFDTVVPRTLTSSVPGRFGGTFTIEELTWDLVRLN